MKTRFILGSLLIGCLMLLVSCTPPATSPSAELVGCKADLTGVFLARRGADSAVIITTYAITNPNKFMVSVDDLISNMDAGLGFVIYEQIPYKYVIPAEDKIIVQGMGILDINYVVADRLFNGDTMAQAIGKILPLWKSVGNMPAGVTKEIWGAVQAKDVVFSYEVSVHTTAQGMEKRETMKGVSQPVK